MPDGLPRNVLLVVADDQLALDSVQLAMPFLASRPGSGWTTFREATAATPLCGPSRATLLTGQHSHQHGVVDNDGSRLDDSSTLATWLHDAGYRTGLVGKYINGFPFGPSARARPGWESWRAFVNVRYRDFVITRDASGRRQRPRAYSTHLLTRAAVRFLRNQDPRPFFLLVGFNAPHQPWTAAPEYDDFLPDFKDSPNFNEAQIADKPGYVRALPRFNDWGELVTRLARLLHYRVLRSVDDGLAAMVAALEETGRVDDTLIIYVGDNGYSFGAHRWGRKRVPYDESARIPYLVRYPASADKTSHVPASSIDVAATIAEVTGIAPNHPLAGESLRPILDGSSTTMSRDAALISFRARDPEVPRYWAVRTEQAKYIEYDTGEQELYDLAGDRWETVNLVNNPASADRRAALAAQLATLKAAAGA